MRALSRDFNVRPRNPGQPAESAKHVHRIWCAEFKINFAKIVTNLLCRYTIAIDKPIIVGLVQNLDSGLDSWTGLWTDIWTGFWTDTAMGDDHFQALTRPVGAEAK